MTKEHLHFTTIREEVNEYEIENGQTLRVKVIISDIVEETTQNGTKKSIHVGFKDFSIVFAKEKIDTSNLEFSTTDKVTDQDVIKELKFNPVKEIVNIYETESLLLLVFPKVEEVRLTNKKSAEGEPILRYGTSIGLNLVNKVSLMPATNLTSSTS